MENKIIITKHDGFGFSVTGGMNLNPSERKQLLQEVLSDIVKVAVNHWTTQDEKNELIANFILWLKDEIVWE